MTVSRLADQAERTRAIRERARNVIVDAGAGTGKTTLLVARLLHLIAPDDDGPALLLERVAAITFTRKAAGELKLRLRESLLTEAGRTDLSPLRTSRLARAVETLDNALISTVHSFADRLLRLRPADARVSPSYEILEDPSDLVEETFRWLLQAAEQGSIAAGLPGDDALERGAEATETLRMFQSAGLPLRTLELEWTAKLGLEAFVQDVIDTRDRALVLPALGEPGLASVRRTVDELQRLVSALSVDSPGTKTLRRLGAHALTVAAARDVTEAIRRAVDWKRNCDRACKDFKKGEHFAGDPAGWETKRWLAEGKRSTHGKKEERPGGALAAELVAPLMAFMAVRLVRLRPVILARYAAVKRAYGVLDQVDLLIELRGLLERDREARAFYQARFDHILVDEFQDTDPLQAEIVLYLCEATATASCAQEVLLAPGKLTIVGDPKQSIYRFRRADIAMYAEVNERIRSGPVCEAQLSVNFRSAASILDWLNDGFDAVLGAPDSGPKYDRELGSVRNVHLVPSGKMHERAGVHVLPFGAAELSADQARDLEGEALAHYLRHLVEDGDTLISDPRTHVLRPPRYGDIAVMMIATQTVHHLTSELDRIGVPHVVRGGTLFMQDALHQQFVLGLRALSDRDDGVARAALMRPPFFAVTLEDLLRAREADGKSEALQATNSLLESLRRQRHETTPGELCRRVLEQTGFGRYVAASVNGAQRLARLYELCLTLDDLARAQQLDFDGVTAIARSWVDAPIRVEAPLPVDADAVQVITAHQAKGLEWPVVALWDGRAGWRAFLPQVAFAIDASTGQWALKLEGLAHDPSERALQERELSLRAEERKRVAYVATTRARDILIIPEAGEPKVTTIAGQLLTSTQTRPQQRVAPYRGIGDAWWDRASGVSMRPQAPMHDDIESVWRAASEQAFLSRLSPEGVASAAHAVRAEPFEEPTLAPRTKPEGRHGPVFGATVHRALELLLTQRVGHAEAGVRQAALELGLTDHQDVALADVTRVEQALQGAGLLQHTLRLEYPIAGSLEPETLLSGYIDLLVASERELLVIDFKTDAPPSRDASVEYPGYVAQVRAYGRLLERSGMAGSRAVRAALLFTADGALRWV